MKTKLTVKQNWKDSEDITKESRPVNALLDENIEFETAMFNIPISKENDGNIIKYITTRFKEKTFDNYEFIEKKPQIQEEEYDVELIETNKELFELYDEIETALKRLIDGGNDGF